MEARHQARCDSHIARCTASLPGTDATASSSRRTSLAVLALGAASKRGASSAASRDSPCASPCLARSAASAVTAASLCFRDSASPAPGAGGARHTARYSSAASAGRPSASSFARASWASIGGGGGS